MARRIEEIFDECLERVNQGESIESCLQSYPEVSDQLKAMLTTSANIKWRGSLVTPRPEFKAKARTQFVRVLTEQNLNAHYHAMKRKYGKHSSIFRLHRLLAPALTVLLVIILIGSAGTVTAAAATGAMPDEALYPAKLATEQIRLALSFTDTDKAILNAQISETRSKEIQVMANQGNTEQVILAAERMFINLENTQLAVSRIVQAQSNLLSFTPTTPEPAPAQPDETTPDLASTPEMTPEPSPTPQDETIPDMAATTEPKPQATEESPRSTADQESTQKTAKPSKTAKLKKSLESAMDDNLNQLELALKDAPEEAKPYIQRAIEITKDKQAKIWAELPSNGNSEENKPGNNSTESGEYNADNAGEASNSSVTNKGNSDNDSDALSPDKGNNGNHMSNKTGRSGED